MDRDREKPEQSGQEKNRPLFSTQFWVILAVIFLVVAYILVLGKRPHAWASRAKGTLRSLGSSQLAYQGTNNEKAYGSFQRLKDDWYLPANADLNRMISNYKLTWDNDGPFNLPPGQLCCFCFHSFTIIAYPNQKSLLSLRTFAITEDQVVRVYLPENNDRHSNDFYAVHTWDPVL
ncbi:MAG TPA: hypothetical protein VGB30_01925 [bacterium]|jgi:hypothetical protein